MANAYKCDRCGEFFTETFANDYKIKGSKRIRALETSVYFKTKDDGRPRRDVCPKCMFDLFGGWAIERVDEND